MSKTLSPIPSRSPSLTKSSVTLLFFSEEKCHLTVERDEVSECSRCDSEGRILVEVITLGNDERHVHLNKTM